MVGFPKLCLSCHAGEIGNETWKACRRQGQGKDSCKQHWDLRLICEAQRAPSSDDFAKWKALLDQVWVLFWASDCSSTLGCLQVPELKAKLKELGLACKGNKPALVERLRNQPCASPPEQPAVPAKTPAARPEQPAKLARLPAKAWGVAFHPKLPYALHPATPPQILNPQP